MTYSPEIPQDLPPPNVAVNFLRTNFSQYQTVFSENHTAMNNSNQGKHEAVIFEQQLVDPEISGNYVALYSKAVVTTVGPAQQLFLKIPQFLPVPPLNLPEQLTYQSVNTTGPLFQTFLPGGYILYFGVVNVVPTIITLVPTPSGIISAVVDANNLSAGLGAIPFDAYATILSTSTFSINSSLASGVYSFTWMAIGVQ